MGQSPTNADAEELIRSLDKDRSGNLSVTEFAEAWWRQEKARVNDFDEAMSLAFKVFDVDGDGCITAGELREKLTTLGEVMTDEEVDELLREADADNSGVINLEEFRCMKCWAAVDPDSGNIGSPIATERLPALGSPIASPVSTDHSPVRTQSMPGSHMRRKLPEEAQRQRMEPSPDRREFRRSKSSDVSPRNSGSGRPNASMISTVV